jgi:hypothetical protein
VHARFADREALQAHRDAEHFTSITVEQLVPLVPDRWIEEFDLPASRSTGTKRPQGVTYGEYL